MNGLDLTLAVSGYSCIVVGIALAFHKRPEPHEVDPNMFGAFDQPPAAIYPFEMYRHRRDNPSARLTTTPSTPRGRGVPAVSAGAAGAPHARPGQVWEDTGPSPRDTAA